MYKFSLSSRLWGFIPQSLQIGPRSTGDCRHLAHGEIKIRRRLQGFQLLLGLRDRLPQKPVPLSQQLRIAGIKFQQLLHIQQLGLGIAYLRIHALQGGLQLGSIAANLHRNALDPVRHQNHLPSKTA